MIFSSSRRRGHFPPKWSPFPESCSQELKHPAILLLLPRSLPLPGGRDNPRQLRERLSKPARKDPAFPITVPLVEAGNVIDEPHATHLTSDGLEHSR